MSSGEEAPSLPVYTWDDISRHNTEESLWVVIEGQVYDVTQFQEEVGTQTLWPSFRNSSIPEFETHMPTIKILKLCNPSLCSDQMHLLAHNFVITYTCTHTHTHTHTSIQVDGRSY